MPAPFVNALNQDQAIGVVQAERDLSPMLRLTTHALFSARQTVLQGIRWESPSGLEARATDGVGGNQPYGSASMAVKREKLDVRMAYITMGDRFRRTGVPSPVQSEADRANVLVTVRPADGFSLGIGRQNFRQDSTLPGGCRPISTCCACGRRSGPRHPSCIFASSSRLGRHCCRW